MAGLGGMRSGEMESQRMFPDEVFKERKDLAREIATAPADYVKDNAAALLRIIWELQASLGLELQVIQGIKRLDVANVSTMSEYLDKFSDYVDRRDFNLERTSCGRIANIYWQQIRPLQSAPDGVDQQVNDLDMLLQRFTTADMQFTEQIEPFMQHALTTLRDMHGAATSGRFDAARAQLDEFAKNYASEVERVKATLRELNDVGQSLLVRL
jgi:hypothetical protein